MAFDYSGTMYQKRDPENRDIRYYETVLLEISRKNFKTFLLGGAFYSPAFDRTEIFKILLGGTGSEAFQ